MTRDPHPCPNGPSEDTHRARADEGVLRLVGLLARQVVRDELSGCVPTSNSESHHAQTDEA